MTMKEFKQFMQLVEKDLAELLKEDGVELEKIYMPPPIDSEDPRPRVSAIAISQDKRYGVKYFFDMDNIANTRTEVLSPRKFSGKIFRDLKLQIERQNDIGLQPWLDGNEVTVDEERSQDYTETRKD